MPASPSPPRRWPLALGLLALGACSPATPPAAPCVPADPAAASVFLRGESRQMPQQLSFSPDGKWLAVTGNHDKLQVREALTGVLLVEVGTTLESDNPWQSSGPGIIGWSTGGDTIALQNEEQILLWDLKPWPPSATPASPRRWKLAARGHSLEIEPETQTLQRRDLETMNEEASAQPIAAPEDPKDRPASEPIWFGSFISGWPLPMGIATVKYGRVTTVDPLSLALTGVYEKAYPGSYQLSTDGHTLIVVNQENLRLIDSVSHKVVFDSSESAERSADNASFDHYTIDMAHQRLAMVHQWRRGTSASPSPLYKIEILDLVSRQIIRTFPQEEWGDWNALVFSPDGSTISIPVAQTHAIDWQIATGQRLGEHGQTFRAAKIREMSPDGRLRAFLDGPRVVVEDLVSHRRLWSRPPGGLLAPMHPVAVSPDGQQMAFLGAGEKRPFVLFRPGEARRSLPIRDPESEVESIAFGPLGATFVSFSRQKNILTFHDPATLEPESVEIPGRGVQTARWSPDGRFLAVTDTDGEATLWANRTLAHRLGGATELRFSEDSSILIGIDSSGQLSAWSTATGEPAGGWNFGLGARFEPADNPARGSPGARSLPSTKHEVVVHSPATSEIIAVNLGTGTTRRQADCLPGQHASSLGLSPRGKTLLLAAGTGLGALCELTGGKRLTSLLPGEAAPRSAAAFDLLGTRVATVGKEGAGSVVRVRDTATGAVLVTYPFTDIVPAEIGLAFTSEALVVSRKKGASFYPFKGCSPIEAQLIWRFGALGWLATDSAGHFDGDETGLAEAGVRGTQGLEVEPAERRLHHLPGLLFGARANPAAEEE